MKIVYLDWNVFNKIEKIETLNFDEQKIYKTIKELSFRNQAVFPYSNAHINDIHRGFLKNPTFIPVHLNTLKTLTNNLCIVQYWTKDNVVWHYRCPSKFLESRIDESTYYGESFAELLKSDDQNINSMVDNRNYKLKSIPIDKSFKTIYLQDPIFNLIYPKTKISMNMLSLCEDIYNFNINIKKDYALYKNFRKYLNQTKLKFPQIRNMISEIDKNSDIPKYLTWDDAWSIAEDYLPSYNTSNKLYDRVIDLYLKTDLKGYKSDEKYANLVDDSLHVFYAAHCDYFITNDSLCLDKAIATYKSLKIKTQVLNPSDFVSNFLLDKKTEQDAI